MDTVITKEVLESLMEDDPKPTKDGEVAEDADDNDPYVNFKKVSHWGSLHLDSISFQAFVPASNLHFF